MSDVPPKFTNIGTRANGTFLIPRSLAEQYPERTYLGSGSYGSVYGLECPVGEDLAVKKFITPFLTVNKAKRCFRELQLVANLKHKNIVKLKGMYTTDENAAEPFDVYFITVYAGPNLNSWLHKETLEGQIFTMRSIKKMISELLRALKYLNSAKVIHRDLKPDNIALACGTGKLTLLDFGFARAFNKSDVLTCDAGMRYYRAIEVVDYIADARNNQPRDERPKRKTKYDERADMWSVGAILCEMLTDEILFRTAQPTPLNSKDNPIVKGIEICGPIPESVIKKMVDPISQKYCREKSNLVVNEKIAKGESTRIDFLQYFQGKARAWHRAVLAKEPKTCAALLNFIDRTLNWDARKRLTIDAALRHPFLSEARVAKEEVVATHFIEDEADRTLDQWQQRIKEFIHTPREQNKEKRKVLVGVRARKQQLRKQEPIKTTRKSSRIANQKKGRRTTST